jgi:hypothetical protein
MVGYKTNTANPYGLARLAPWVGLLILALLSSSAAAGTLAQLQFPAKLAGKIKPPIDLCVSVSHTPGCRAAIEGALASTTARGGPIRAPSAFERGAVRIQAVAGEPESQHALAVKFYTEPEWQRQARTLSHEGLTLLRRVQGANHEFTVGITPKGLLGFSLKDSTE